MSKERLTWLLEQHLSGNATEHERQELLALVKANADEALFTQVMSEMMQQETPNAPVNAAPWKKMAQDIVKIDKRGARGPGRLYTLYRWAAAAAVLLLTGTGVYFYLNSNDSSNFARKTIPVLPMTPENKNSLLLYNGSNILLDETKDGQIAIQENTIVTKRGSQIVYTTTDNSAALYYNVLSTARSGQYEVVLPDGSQVWLNSASAIRFPASFSGKERSVELMGEAWFDVRHADKIPFVIHSGNITTSVMGTAFNIKAYPGERVMTVSVQRGRVKVQSGDRLLATLEKGRQVKVTAEAGNFQSEIDTASIAGWKKGNLYYKDERFVNIVADLQRVFNDSIQIRNASLKNVITTASVNKSIGIRKVLDIICRITDARFSENNGIYIIE